MVKLKSFFMSAVAAATVVLTVASCGGDSAEISGILKGASEDEVTVAVLNVNEFVRDTLKTDISGKYSCKVKVEKGDPEFVYIYHKGKQIAALILRNGERCNVVSDTDGAYTVSGSEESEKLSEVVRREAEFNSFINRKLSMLSGLDENDVAAEEIKSELSKGYIKYYRSCVRYIMKNPYSLSSLKVLYQNVAGSMPVFSQITDAYHFKNTADSLMIVYPESRYVKALADEAGRRMRRLDIDNKLKTAERVGYLDIVMPDVNGCKSRLSDIKAKVIMVYFWSTDLSHNLFDTDVLKTVYDLYHNKGFEIYGICIGTDKIAWSSVVKNRKLNWVNVCDGLGTNSPVLGAYSVTRIPSAVFIVDGVIVDGTGVKDVSSLESFLDKNL